MSHYFPDPDTGYVDDDPLIQAQDEAHEAEEEARDLEELQAAHSPESDPDPEPDYLRFAIDMARQQGARSQSTRRQHSHGSHQV
jgi:hypothetical protein